MTRAEFGAVIAYLTAGCGKPLMPESINVYFDLLSDLPLPVLQVAAQRALAESEYNAFPPIGVLRKLATEALAGEQPTAGQAWGMVRKAMIAPAYYQRQMMAAWPDAVRETVECVGWARLCASEEPTSIVYAQFVKAYEGLAAREQRQRALPAPARKTLGQLTRQVAGQIGHMPEE